VFDTGANNACGAATVKYAGYVRTAHLIAIYSGPTAAVDVDERRRSFRRETFRRQYIEFRASIIDLLADDVRRVIKFRKCRGGFARRIYRLLA